MDISPEPNAPVANTSHPSSGHARRAPRTRGSWLAGQIRQLSRDTIHVLVCFPLSVVSFSVIVTGTVAAVGLIPLALVGLVVGVVVLYLAQGFAAMQRVLVRFGGFELESPRYRPIDPGASLIRRLLARFRDLQQWMNVLHGIVVFPISLATFVVGVVWWSAMLGGLTYGLWEPWLLEEPGPEENRTLAEAFGWGISPILFQFLAGVFALVTLIPVLRACAGAHNLLARGLLSNSRVRALREQVDTLTVRRAAIAEAEVRSLQQLERDLHDGPQQRLVRLGMDLAAAERRLDSDPEESRRLVADARSMTADALAELRQLSRGIAPPILTDRGLPAAVDALGARSTIPVRTEMDVSTGRPAVAVETAAYFVISEALTNAAKHSGADLVTVSVHDRDGVLDVKVTDNGVGGALLAKGHGLAGLAERVEGLDGTFTVSSPPGGPTTISVRLPR